MNCHIQCIGGGVVAYLIDFECVSILSNNKATRGIAHRFMLFCSAATMAGWWFGTFFLCFHSVGNFIIPIDFHIFQRGRLNHQPYP